MPPGAGCRVMNGKSKAGPRVKSSEIRSAGINCTGAVQIQSDEPGFDLSISGQSRRFGSEPFTSALRPTLEISPRCNNRR